jgi:HAD superfamily hydrolase (TIGR01509 family)
MRVKRTICRYLKEFKRENMKGIIFDMDGTMVDNMMVHHRIWQKQLKELGLDLSLEQVHQQIHGVNEEIFERLFQDRFTKEERRQLAFEKEATYRRIFKKDIQLIAGLPKFLDLLKDSNIPMGIGSAAPPENVDFVLDTLGIRHYFKIALHSGDVEKGKPNPEIYHKVAGHLNLAAEECIVFEDSPTGAEAASRAGSKIIVVTTTHEKEEFQQIPNILAYINDFKKITPGDLGF